MSQPLRHKLLSAMSRATSQAPIATDALAAGHNLHQVEQALMALYHERSVGCMKHTKSGTERVVWWPTGQVTAPSGYRQKKKVEGVE